MNSRRDFLKKASLLAGGVSLLNGLPGSVQKAMAINPDPGSTFYDAEHVVLLMQENRSFDHCFGTLQGVRGYRDPRAVYLANRNSVWLQTNRAGKTYAPFRLDLRDTKATWMSALPHSWASQVDARNNGKHDGWLDAKRSGNKAYADMPLTMGYYNREDLPFYYALADAFTICDQHFCSSLTATTPNRLFYWTGTVRERPSGNAPPNINNQNVNDDSEAGWTTFPERLEKNGISWRIYQNELSVGVGFTDDEDDWLANFTNNPLEWFSQYQVRFSPAHYAHLNQKAAHLEQAIGQLPEGSEESKKKKEQLHAIRTALETWDPAKWEALSEYQKNIHNKAFTTNVNDPFYHELTTLDYDDDGVKRTMQIPKGDVLHQFREDVKNGNLPTVSWLIAPANFSDHPGAPWYGAWYVSEVLDILTKDPEVWKKTIFILTYDENDGYFDHIPPFVAPDPGDPRSGRCSAPIDTTVDYVTAEQAKRLRGTPKDPERISPIGLGYRVPFIVASPWSRGGWVNSQVFDNTSVLMFLEKFLTEKTGVALQEENISPWRRAICGDLTSIFRPYNGEKIKLPSFVEKTPFVESIYNAKFKRLPFEFIIPTEEEINAINRAPLSSPMLPKQEPGIRPACPLPYEIYAEGTVKAGGKQFDLVLEAGNECFGSSAAGVPFIVYDMMSYSIRNYAVIAGDQVRDQWDIADVTQGYHFCVYGPNGFFREFIGQGEDRGITIQCRYENEKRQSGALTGNGELKIKNNTATTLTITIDDNAYHASPVIRRVKSGRGESVLLNLERSFGWYDFTLRVRGNVSYKRRYAGRVETGKASFTDPAMGQVEL